MSWFRCDDQLGDHPKVLALDDKALPAMGLWLLCGVYCSKRLTDGFIPHRLVKQLSGERLAKDLERAGLFEKASGGWTMHDYLQWNPSREEVLRRRAERKAAGMAGAKARWIDDAMGQPIASAIPESHSGINGRMDAPYPVPVSQVLSNVPDGAVLDPLDFMEPWQIFEQWTHRKASQKVRDWLEDLHVRHSRRELVAAMKAIPDPRKDGWLNRVDAYLEGTPA